MISTMESVFAAVQEIKKGWQEWKKVEDGFMLYEDFTFATDSLFKEYQRLIDLDDEISSVTFGSCYGLFPRAVRTYYPLLHQTYPLHHYQKPKGELADLVKKVGKRQAAKESDTKGDQRVGKEEAVVQMIGKQSKSRSSRQQQRWAKRNNVVQPYKPLQQVKPDQPNMAVVTQDDESEFVDIVSNDDSFFVDNNDDQGYCEEKRGNQSRQNSETDDDFLFYIFESMYMHSEKEHSLVTDDIIMSILDQQTDVLEFCGKTLTADQWNQTLLHVFWLDNDADLGRFSSLIARFYTI